ncbi:hypothetical protein M758_2G248100 [Ceratodon purpureus]|nr:hypothetical protein M758_2G248100 [Ceratodon purpureus]
MLLSQYRYQCMISYSNVLQYMDAVVEYLEDRTKTMNTLIHIYSIKNGTRIFIDFSTSRELDYLKGRQSSFNVAADISARWLLGLGIPFCEGTRTIPLHRLRCSVFFSFIFSTHTLVLTCGHRARMFAASLSRISCLLACLLDCFHLM